MDWYLLQAKPNGHTRAVDNLRRQGFEVFCPLVVKTTKKKSKFFNNTSPLFPGYLFMGTRIKPAPWNSINGTRGVIRGVTLDGKYHPIDKNIIEGLKYRCDNQGIVQKLDDIIPGDRVRITRGPFADFICKVDEVSFDKRAWILIDLLQKQARTEISLDHLSKIS